jgi:hypothetical protein
VQKQGAVQRTLVFQDHVGNRNPAGTPAGNGGDPALPHLDKLMIGNNSVNGLLFDEIYISTTGYNSTLPQGSPSTPGVGPKFGVVNRTGTNLTIEWTGGGSLETASSIVGPWTTLTGASSPYSTTTGNAPRFFRVRK